MPVPLLGTNTRTIPLGRTAHAPVLALLNCVRPVIPISAPPDRKSNTVTILGIALSAICGVIALVSASGKFIEVEPVVGLLDHVQVTGLARQALPYLQVAGGFGALLGLFVAPWLGVAALIGLTLYFLGAVGFHLRVGDPIAGFGGPLALAAVMAVAAVVRAATI